MIGAYVQFSRVGSKYMRMGTYPTREEAEANEWVEISGTRFVEAPTEKLEPTLKESDFLRLNWWTVKPAEAVAGHHESE